MDKQQTQYRLMPKWKWKMLTNCWKFPKSECPDIWIRLPRHKWPKSWSSMEDPVVPLERNLYGHLLAGLLWERQFEKILLKHGWEKRFQIGNVSLYIVKKDFSYLCVWMKKLAGKNLDPMWKLLNKEVDLGEPTFFLDHVNLGCTQRQCEISKDIVGKYRTMFESRISAGLSSLKISVFLHGLVTWLVMQRNVWNDTVSWRTRRLSNSTKYLLHASMTTTSKKKKWICWRIVTSMLSNCSEMSMLSTNGRPDIQWSVNKFARSITKWTKVCDKRLNRLISYIHHTCEYKQCCCVGITAKQCRLGLFQDSDFAGDLEDSKSTSGGTLCVFGSHIFVRISWMCKKQTSVSHSSTNRSRNQLFGRWIEIRRDSCSRFVGSDCFCFRKHDSDFWETGATHYHWQESKISRENQRAEKHWLCSLKRPVFAPRSIVVCGWGQRSSDQDDHERSPTMRHVSRTHRVALDWLFARINLDSKIQIKYIDTKNQLADILTKGKFHTWWVESFVVLV